MFPRMKLLAIALLTAACGASSTQNPNTTAGPGPNMECHEETTPTSSVPREVCRPKAAATNADGSPTMPNQPAAPPPPTMNH
jgi:hypothetical protein